MDQDIAPTLMPLLPSPLDAKGAVASTINRNKMFENEKT